MRKLNEFLEANNAQKDFNEKQKVVLVASDFDEQTLSAVAWLNSNNVDMSCYKLTPYKLGEEIYFHVEKILPFSDYDDYYVNLMDRSSPSGISSQKKMARRNLPRIDSLLEWGAVRAGDIIVPKGREGAAELLPNGNVLVDGEEKSMQVWLKAIYGWSSIQTYEFAVHRETGKTLAEIRKEYMERNIEL